MTTNDIILKPAKRVLVLYFLALLFTLAVLGFSLQLIGQALGIEIGVLMYVWNVIAIIGAGLLCYAALWRLTCTYSLTHECVLGSTGILSRQHIRIALSRIVDYRVMRPLIERIIGLGDLHIDTAGRDGDELVMHQISHHQLDKVVLRLNALLNQVQKKSERSDKVDPLAISA